MSTMTNDKPRYEKQFTDRGGHYSFRLNDTTAAVTDHLPAAIYEIVVENSPLTGIDIRWAKLSNTFKVPEKRFGNHNKHMERIKADFDRVNPAMGVLLAGLKGSGKSMFAEDLGNWVVGQGLPVLLISQPIGPDLLRFIIANTGPCMVYFDEFGKVYPAEERNKLLTLFSDSTLTGVLFVVTGNEKSEFPDMIYDRPGRFRYRMTFTDLKSDSAVEVGEYYRLTDLQMAGLARYLNTHNVSYDMLCSVALMIRGCKTDKEIAEYLEIMNVPRWGRVEPEITSLRKGDLPFALIPNSVTWDTQTLRARGCVQDDIDNVVDIELPLVETVDYYRNHEQGGGPYVETIGDFTITYNFKIMNNFTPKLGATLNVDFLYDKHAKEVKAQRAAAAEKEASESPKGPDNGDAPTSARLIA